jgi:hypothetical protein
MKFGNKINKDKIQVLGLKAIQEYFDINPNDLDKETLKHLHQKAKLGMQFEREMNLNQRLVERNYLKVFRWIAEDKVELKRLIKKNLPKYRF